MSSWEYCQGLSDTSHALLNLDSHVVNIPSALRLHYHRRAHDCGGLVYAKRSSSGVCGFAKLNWSDADTMIRTIRTALMLTLACCYLSWMITYLAQLHPLICE